MVHAYSFNVTPLFGGILHHDNTSRPPHPPPDHPLMGLSSESDFHISNLTLHILCLNHIISYGIANTQEIYMGNLHEDN